MKHYLGRMVLFVILIGIGINGSLLAQDTSTPKQLPLGDGKVSSTPQVGYVYSCQTTFNGGGAQHVGPWIDVQNGTFDPTAKAVVDGSVSWPDHNLSITLDGSVRHITTNDLPNHPTGVYPISPSDDAYQYDRNPNHISAQNVVVDLPANPTVAAQPSCLGMGPIGVTTSGVLLFNALDAAGRDAVAHETQDSCQGHPESNGSYHYHSLSSCLNDGGTPSPLIGYAMDGFGIYGPRDASGKVLTNADLDECHGMTSEITWDGKQVVMYHYVATYEYPYTLGCYRGTSVRTNLRGGNNGGTPPNGGGNGAAPNNSGNGAPPNNGGNGAPPNGGGNGAPQNNSGNGAPPNGGAQAGRPDLAAAAAKLGISEQTLRDALGAPPPDFAAAAAKLGISEQALRDALGVPNR